MRAAVPDADLAIGMGARRGGLRAGLPAGALTRGPLYDVFPFDNRIATLVMTGAQVRQALARQLARGWGGIPSVSGVRVRGWRATGPARSSRSFGRRERPSPRPRRSSWPPRTSSPRAPPATPPSRGARPSLAMAPLVRDAVVNWLSARGGRLRAADLTTPPRWEAPGGATCLAASPSAAADR